MADWVHGEELYHGKKVLVLGAARSGISAAHLLLRLTSTVVLNDRNLPKEGDAWVEELEAKGATVILGSHPEGIFEQGFDLVVKNPGIPYTHPYIQEAQVRKIPIITEVELGYSILEGKLIGITGSNGKTTTTTLVGQMIAKRFPETIIAGNIGKVFSEQVQNSSPSSIMVTELSSFQLKGIESFKPDIACLLNVYHHHLDYHQTMEDYIASKQCIFQNQMETDYAVLNWDQELTRSFAPSIRAKIYGFSRSQELEQGAFLKNYLGKSGENERWVVFRSAVGQEPIIPVPQIALLGEHNLENVLASVIIAKLCDVRNEDIADVLRTFTGVEHRLEFVAEKMGVRYYNDSKATNPEATEHALLSFSQPVILLAGGLERGGTYEELIPIFASKVKCLIAYGQTKEKLQGIAERAGVNEVVLVDNVSEGVQKAASQASSGDIVILSPACASWDLYSSFEERGRIFKEAVHSL